MNTVHMDMKVRFSICFFTLLVLLGSSCQKEFLQKPDTTGYSTLETVFSTFSEAQYLIANVYSEVLKQGLPYEGDALNLGTLAALSGELSRGWSWHYAYYIVNNGLNASQYTEDDYMGNYEVIRKCYLIKENIDRVEDIDEKTKKVIKAEMDCLIAYRYMGMLIRYGGVPIVERALTSDEDLFYSRNTLQETLDYILKLCDSSAKDLPDDWPSQWEGRVTKGIALAIKARTLTYSARALFNSGSPYLSFGENNDLICFGDKDQGRWIDAVSAIEELLEWSSNNDHHIINTGGQGEGLPNPNAFDDYGTATSVPGNDEVLLAYKISGQNKLTIFYNISTYATMSSYEPAMSGMHSNFLSNYYKSDGRDQVWPGLGTSNALSGNHYLEKMRELEPRFQVDNKPHGLDALNNEGDQGWATDRIQLTVNRNGAYGKGNAFSTKYYYKAGSRVWFEFPLFRLAEFYLSLAEAYNELGNTDLALRYLNVVHNRAGLPAITEKDPGKLESIIQREWAVEYYNENQRYFLLKHWKHPEIGNGLIGGPRREFQFTTNELSSWYPESFLTYYDQVVFNAYWDTKMFLSPFPQNEINKGALVQNPGY